MSNGRVFHFSTSASSALLLARTRIIECGWCVVVNLCGPNVWRHWSGSAIPGHANFIFTQLHLWASPGIQMVLGCGICVLGYPERVYFVQWKTSYHHVRSQGYFWTDRVPPPNSSRTNRLPFRFDNEVCTPFLSQQ